MKKYTEDGETYVKVLGIDFGPFSWPEELTVILGVVLFQVALLAVWALMV